MTSSMGTTHEFVHRANIVKYQRILGTYLTDYERCFVEHRLSEEQAALRQIVSNVGTEAKSSYAA